MNSPLPIRVLLPISTVSLVEVSGRVEAALVIGAVGEFVNGWRLEAAAGGR